MNDAQENVTELNKDGNDDDTQDLPSAIQNAPDILPTHFAIDVRTCADLRKLLGKGHDYDEVAPLIRGLEAGAPLTLGSVNQ